MKKFGLALFVVLVCLAVFMPAVGGAELERGFVLPDDSSKAGVYWWWLHGYVTKDGIVRDLDHMKRVGIGSALVFNAGGGKTPGYTEFMSTAWRELFRFAVEEAAKRNITISLNICDGWNAGGPWVKEEDAPKELAFCTVKVKGPAKYNDILANKVISNDTYHDISVLAWPVKSGTVLSSGMVDLTDKMDSEGRLRWDVPQGDWRVIRMGWVINRKAYTDLPGGKSYLEIDPMSKKTMDKHFASTVGVVIEDVKKYAGKTFKYVHIDSGEIGNPNWSQTFREDFERLRGYDPLPYIAAMEGSVVDSDEVTDLFKEDYAQTIADLMIECYYGYLGELARPYGLGTHSEAAGYQKPAVDALRGLGVNDICMSEFWSRGWYKQTPGDNYIHQLAPGSLRSHDGIKNASSAAHTYGRKIVQGEAFTVIRKFNYDRTPFDLKDIGDRAFCAGLNRNVFHNYISQAEEQSKPGYAWPGTGPEFDRHSTLWPMASAWTTYLGRCQYLLQQGRFAGDICYLQDDLAPAYVPAKWAMDPPLPRGYDCDTINSDALIRRADVDKDGGLLLADGQRYRYLVLKQAGRWKRPQQDIFVPSSVEYDTSVKCPQTGSGNPIVVKPETLRKIKKLVESGLTVIGPKPQRAPGLSERQKTNSEIKKLADELWGKNPKEKGQRKVGKGRIIWGQSLAEVMAADGLEADIEIVENAETKALPVETFVGIASPTTFDWIHRTVDGAEIYFIANLRNARASGTFTFRVTGKQPELWDAVTGKIRDASAFTEGKDGRISMPLEFAERGSIFVVFRKPLSSGRILAKTNFLELSPVMKIAGPWEVKFDPEWGGPESVVFDELKDWSERPEDGIKYYSGKATYSTTFDLPKKSDNKRTLYLDLGKFNHIADVRLNGKEIGVVWTAPWQVDVTGVISSGTNNLEIDVANLWHNRLVGDAALDDEKRFTKTNVKPDNYKNQPLLPSGLIGPVRLLIEK